jgi:acetyl-CoA/propionyl-CoA carboxylase biotin carboxyl carrier protein
MFGRILIANRGEIALRILRACRQMSISAVVVYSEADRDSRAVQLADEAICIGPAESRRSYLSAASIISAAVVTGCEAIHPGYGFLSEDDAFAEMTRAHGLTFIGPPPEVLERFASKSGTRELLARHGLPTIPGSNGMLRDDTHALDEAERIGYPVLIKPSAGGGGKGFRVALSADELQSAFEGASREGERYFSDGAVYLERYLHDPRHVEVQLLADHHGAIIHLGERDCSVQRRHQKLIEEAPGPHAADPDYAARLRAKLGEIAVGAARAVGYRNAGTIECLLGPDGEPFFLEMNTRVQVEHTVTEMVTGIDIVAEQLRIAAGEPLRLTQDDVELRGHALECRINAEDARHDFRPSSGPIIRWNEPSGIGVRVDSGFAAGSTVTPFYDTLLAKLVVHAEDRDAAIQRMRRALDEFEVSGVETLVDFHRAAMDPSSEFASGGTCRELVADPTAAIDALPVPVGRSLPASPAAVTDPVELLMEIDGRRAVVKLHDPTRSLPEPPPVRPRGAGAAGAHGEVLAPIPGNVLQVLVEAGQVVAAGQVVCILEAMKMENEIAAPAGGTVESVRVQAGEAVGAGAVLLSVAAGDEDAS